MKGMLIVALEGEVENTEVQPKLEYGNWSIWKPKYEKWEEKPPIHIRDRLISTTLISPT